MARRFVKREQLRRGNPRASPAPPVCRGPRGAARGLALRPEVQSSDGEARAHAPGEAIVFGDAVSVQSDFPSFRGEAMKPSGDFVTTARGATDLWIIEPLP